MEHAPILISVYDRADHLKQCIDSLRQNPFSQDSLLYIVSDAAHSPQHQARIESVREYIDQVSGFKGVIPIKRERNLGSFLSVTSAIGLVLEKHGSVIFLEDDNTVSTNFLQFLNDCLKFYKEDASVFCVCGYNFPVKIPKGYPHDVYRWPGFCAWGVGLWIDRWKTIEWNYAGFEKVVENKVARRSLEKRLPQMYSKLLPQVYSNVQYYIKNGIKVADSQISWHMFVKGTYSIFPVVSQLKNTGHDGSGEHCGSSELFMRQSLSPEGGYRLIKLLQSDDDVDRALVKYFRRPIKARFYGMLSKMIPEAQKKSIKGRFLQAVS